MSWMVKTALLGAVSIKLLLLVFPTLVALNKLTFTVFVPSTVLSCNV